MLAQDEPFVRRASGVHTELLPCPYLGSPDDATVFALNLNPSYTASSANYVDEHYSDEWRQSLTFGSTYPFWALDPSLSASPGYKWWAPLTAQLRSSVPSEIIARRLMCLQWFPYHTAGLADLGKVPILPSQAFTFGLLRTAIKRGSFVVVMRSEALWLASVPELRLANYTRLRNVRRPFFTPGNMTSDSYQRLVHALTE